MAFKMDPLHCTNMSKEDTRDLNKECGESFAKANYHCTK